MGVLLSLVLAAVASLPSAGIASEIETIVVTAARHDQPLDEAPRAMTVIDRTQFEQQHPKSVVDLLRGQVGVSVQQTTPGQGTPIIRGLLGSSILVLVDGMRLNSGFFRPAPNQYFTLLDPFNVERIEIVRGVSSTLYGSDAMGGVVNVITPTPRFDGDEWQATGDALGQYASANNGTASRLSVAAGRSGIAASAGVTYQNFDDLRAGRGRVQDPSAYDVWSADAKVAIEGDSQDGLVSVQYLRQDETPRYDELVPGFGQTEPSSVVFSFEPNDRFFAHARYRYFDPLPWVQVVSANLAFQDIDDDRRSRDFGGTVEQRERNQSRQIGGTLQAVSPWESLGALFTYGADVYLDETESSRKETDIDTGLSENVPARFANGSNLDSFGLFLQSEIEVTSRLIVRLGSRFSFYGIHVPAADRGVGVSEDFTDITGEGAVSYQLMPELWLVSSAGRSFRVPNVFDLSTLGPRPGNRFNLPNPDLEPEEMIGTDLGFRCVRDDLQAEIFGFYSRYNDKILEVDTGETTPDGRDIVRNDNASEVDLWGIEAGTRYDLTPQLTPMAVLNYTWGEEKLPDGSAGPADRIIPLGGRLGLIVRPWDTVSIEPFIDWAANQNRLSDRDKDDPRIDPRGTDGWATLNVKATWEPTSYLRLGFELQNVSDERYREHGSGIDASGLNAIVSTRASF